MLAGGSTLEITSLLDGHSKTLTAGDHAAEVGESTFQLPQFDVVGHHGESGVRTLPQGAGLLEVDRACPRA